jgi:hypothetical protein
MAEWEAVLALADRWALDALRAHAVGACGALFADNAALGGRQLSLGQRFGVHAWVRTGALQLVTHKASLTRRELALHSAETVANVLEVRDANMRWTAAALEGDKHKLHADTMRWIKEVFDQLNMVRVAAGRGPSEREELV